jgi:peptidyl-prolyl cis-trans isomerase C
MNESRSRSGRELLAAWLLSIGLLAGHAFGQPANDAAPPSPVAPGDLSRPVFDTTKPVYDSVPSLDKSASAVVAEVEGRPITMGDVGDAIRALPPGLASQPFNSLYPSVLEQLIKQEALVVRAQQQGADEDPAIRRRVRSAADRQLAEEFMQRELSKNVTETELLDRYQRDIAGRPGPDEVRLRVILTSTEKEAADLFTELRGGADFAAVARRASKDTTAPAGGDLGFNTRDRLTPEIGAVAFTTSLGQLVPGPVHGDRGWFIIKVEERRQQPTPMYAAVREQLKQAILREGVAPLVEEALKDLKIRRYNFMGGEVEAPKPEAR